MREMVDDTIPDYLGAHNVDYYRLFAPDVRRSRSDMEGAYQGTANLNERRPTCQRCIRFHPCAPDKRFRCCAEAGE